MFKRVVDVVEYVGAAAAVVTVALLLFYKPTHGGTYNPGSVAVSSSATASGSTGSATPSVNGAAVYSDHCSGCHGPKGEGSIGPKLAGGAVARKYPNAADETAIVTNGRGGMPAWRDQLTPEQIQAVVAYTRTGLG